MPRTYPDYVERRINLAIQRREHRASAPPGCACVFCLPPGGVMAAIMARIEARRAEIGEPPF
jgi:hypothetical protein